jgi:hypothetical protein
MLTAIAAGQDPIMEAALGQMGMTELVNLLSAYASFMSAPLIDAELGSFASDIRRVRTAETADTTMCGAYIEFASGAGALPPLRAIVYIARREFAKEGQVQMVKTSLPQEDEAKDLPSDTIDAMRSQLGSIMGGLTCPRAMRSTTLMSRMSHAARKGGFLLLCTYALKNKVVTELLRSLPRLLES